MHPLLWISVISPAFAVYLPLEPRVDPCLQEVADREAVTLDGTTVDGTAGIGAEFESPFFYFISSGCSEQDTFAARKQIINGRTGTNWLLTADTGMIGKVNAEYILNGQNIKVGNGDAAKTGKAVADDLIGWKPWTGEGKQTVDIANNNCNPWTIDGPSKKTKPEVLPWSPQITAPMPLEALYSLMKEQQSDPPPSGRNILDGFPGTSMFTAVVATQAYFQSNPNGIEASKVTDDVLAFCSLILSYAKAASLQLGRNQSPKFYTTFMPRNDFNTLYQQVKSGLPGDLFPLLNSLACYKTDKDRVVVDEIYCSGPDTAPVPNGKFGTLSYTNTAAAVNIKDWIEGIGKQDPTPDLLSKFDESIDGSIGGLGSKTEKMFNSQRSVPLFEFRDLAECTTADTPDTIGIETFMSRVDGAIQELHKNFANAPKGKRDIPTSCTLPNGPAETTEIPSSPPTPRVAPVNPPSEPSCVPNPTSRVKDSHQKELSKAASFFCDKYATATIQTSLISIAHTIIAGDRLQGQGRGSYVVNVAYDYPPKMGNQDDVYDMAVTSVDNCKPEGGFNLGTPVPDHKCADVMFSAWKNCKTRPLTRLSISADTL
ncbi:MAG: hypothetical protein LQ349_005388 [Xanthoria aureola]|nr:MAG: hypothetical protein LQ349_005388 [Xanthoria aureola]